MRTSGIGVDHDICTDELEVLVVHGNAPLSETGRLRLARCVVEDGWSYRRAAERFQVCPSTARRWAGRYRQAGAAGMVDRSSRPHRCPRRTPTRTERRIITLRFTRRRPDRVHTGRAVGISRIVSRDGDVLGSSRPGHHLDWPCAVSGSAGFPPSDRSSPPDLVQTFTALQSLLLTAQGIDEFLIEVAKLAAGVAHPAASCGITIRRHGQPLTVASSDSRAEQVDQVQYGAGTGPCLDSLESGAVIDVPDLTADTRWAEFRHQALAHGIRSSVSIPLNIDGSTVGALNLYGSHRHAFDQAARQHAETFATQAATALTLALRNADQARDTAQLEQALTSRTVIDQALGILMAQQQCTADEAFALLRAHSQNNNRKLHDVAADLITRVSGQPPGPGHNFHRQQPTA